MGKVKTQLTMLTRTNTILITGINWRGSITSVVWYFLPTIAVIVEPDWFHISLDFLACEIHIGWERHESNID